MKTNMLILVLMVLAGCGNPSPVATQYALSLPAELVAIDSLMQTRPDSALCLLLEKPMDGPYYQLLLSEALYKNDSAQSNRTELLSAVAYYDSVGCPFLSARAHYINGVGYYEMDSVVSACREYLKALEIMEEHFEENELVGYKAKFMALTYNRLGDIFSGRFMMEAAIMCYENAFIYCNIEPTSPNGASNILYRIGKQYDKLNDINKAGLYYEKAIENIKNTETSLYRDIVANKSVADYQSGVGYEYVLDEIRSILVNAENENERLNRLLVMGSIFKEERHFDSAISYLMPVFQNDGNTALRIRAAENMLVIYDSLGNTEKADECMRFLTDNMRSEGESMALVSKLDNSFQNYLKQKQDRQYEIKRLSTVKNIVVIVVLLTIIIISVVILFAKTKAKIVLQRQRMDTEKMLEARDRMLDKEKKARQLDKAKLQRNIMQKEGQISSLEKALKQQRNEAELRREGFLKEPICCKINENVRIQHITVRNGSRKTIPFSDNDAVALRAAVLRHYENFETVLLSKYPKMSMEDMQICQFYLLGLNERQIAVLQCKTYSTIKKRADMLRLLLGLNTDISAYILGL